VVKRTHFYTDKSKVYWSKKKQEGLERQLQKLSKPTLKCAVPTYRKKNQMG